MEERVALIVSLIFLLLPFGLFFRESEYVEFLEKSWVSKEHRPLDWRRDMPSLTIRSCVVMLANIASKPMVIVLLDSIGKFTRLGDAQRVKHWLETGETMPAPVAKPAVLRSPAKAPAAKQAKRVQGKFAANGKSGRG